MDEDEFGHVGGPTLGIEFKLVDIPEMEYWSADNRGEVCVRGDSVFRGYFKNEEATAATIDKDGWNHTGDVGMLLPNGALKLIDRKKNIFKLQQGEYISPERIENIVCRDCEWVAEMFLHGDSL